MIADTIIFSRRRAERKRAKAEEVHEDEESKPTAEVPLLDVASSGQLRVLLRHIHLLSPIAYYRIVIAFNNV